MNCIEFCKNLVNFKTRETTERHLHDFCCLNVGKVESFNKLFLYFGNTAGSETDNLYYFINVVNGNFETFQNVSSLFCFVKIELDSSFNYFSLVVDVVAEHLL